MRAAVDPTGESGCRGRALGLLVLTVHIKYSVFKSKLNIQFGYNQ